MATTPASRRRGRRVLLTALGVVAMLGATVALYVWAIPSVAVATTTWISTEFEVKLGAGVVDRLAPPDRRCQDAEGQEAVEAILDTVLAPLGPVPYEFTVTVLDDPRVSAFAVPGGHVVISRGLLERTRTADELAGVLAHEIQHILHRHGTKAILRQASMAAFRAVVGGDADGAALLAIDGARVLGTLGYSRDAEREADQAGMRMLISAGVDPRGLIDVLETLAGAEPAASGGVRYVSAHPATADRLEALTAMAAANPSPGGRLMADEEWMRFRAMCDVSSR